jgi:1-acyl-sn-glycerol-3-phosphate acyltransferase
MTREVRPVEAQAWTTPLYKKAIQRGSFALIRSICDRRLALQCFGIEHLPERGPFIVIANHTSHVDTGVLMTALGKHAGQVHPTAAADYWFRSKLIAWALHSTLGAIPFDRHSRNIPTAAALPAQVLRNGHSLIFYPEGSRSDTGEMQKFKSTIGLLALASGAPVLPAYITGAAGALPKGESRIRRHPVRVHFGRPRMVESYLACLDQESLSSVAHRLADDVQEAVWQLRPGGVAAETAISSPETNRFDEMPTNEVNPN